MHIHGTYHPIGTNVDQIEELDGFVFPERIINVIKST